MKDQIPAPLRRCQEFEEKNAIVDAGGPWSYAQLFDGALSIASGLLAGRTDLAESRVVFLVPPGFEYAATLWGIWAAGGVAVPLEPRYPIREIEYVVDDTDPSAIIVSKDLKPRIHPTSASRSIPIACPEELLRKAPGPVPDVSSDRRAMILYTSGTTSRPKGVVTTHSNIQAQIESLVEAWRWESDDRILNPLPLHHVHGIINILSCSLWAGATCELPGSFDAAQVFGRLSSGDFTLFMAVPTVYVRLISEWMNATDEEQESFSRACEEMRLMVSGSAALPVSVLESWQAITRQVLLERYGMTEIGMALSNSYEGRRRPGFVGRPLPGVEIKLVDDEGRTVVEEGASGEIYVRGQTVFREYWRREPETAAAFENGWFRTGDIAVVEDGEYRIRGRKSVDIIKTGGYKVSALEIEEILRDHPRILECVVVGLPDPEWGERVALAAILSGSSPLELDELRAWASERLAREKIPTVLLCVDSLPRNALGKVQKPAVKALFLKNSAEVSWTS